MFMLAINPKHLRLSWLLRLTIKVVETDRVSVVIAEKARSIRKGCPAGLLLPDWLVAARDRGDFLYS